MSTAPAGASFSSLGVPASLVDVLAARGIDTPTPIQSATLGDALSGRDVLGRGRTGSGKTYAFLLPLVARLAAATTRTRSRQPRAVILAPTRELVNQIDEALRPLAAVAELTSRTVFGGVGQQPQAAALQRGVDVVVACPGRLEDLVGQGLCRLDAVEITVLDEADHMADLGFLPGVTRLLALTPRDGQRLFFSATLDRGVDGLVRRFLTSPARHEADSPQAPVAAMDHHVLHLRDALRTDVLVDLGAAPGRTVIFTRTKYRAKALTRQLNARGVPAVELHGNLSQGARTRSMDAFHAGTVSTLVATDIAARGIHVDDVELVVHADPPVEHKAYVHRSGRTARAGRAGTVVTLMTDAQVGDVRGLVRAAGIKPTTTVVDALPHPVLEQLAPGERSFQAAAEIHQPAPGRGTGGGSGRRRQSGKPAQPRSSSAKPRSSSAKPRSSSAQSRTTPAQPTTTGERRPSRGRRGAGRSGAGAGGSTTSASAARAGTGSRGHSASEFSRRSRSR